MRKTCLAIGLATSALLCMPASHATTPAKHQVSMKPESTKPVYIHMNGGNEFLERLVFVTPGQKVIFVNEDTGPHAIRGYDPATGAKSKTFDDAVIKGTPGAGHKVATYAISFAHQGVQWYYCPVHAELAKAPGGVWWPKVRPGVHGFGTPMAGAIVVTTDTKMLADNPKTSHEKILPNYFGG